jgi:hypothetical protein
MARMSTPRPPRAELFGFYWLGFAPDGSYKFPNANHLAAHYRVGPEAVMGWLEHYGIDPATVARTAIELSALSVDIQLDLPNLTPEGVRARVAEALAAFDAARGGRRPWIDGPIR